MKQYFNDKITSDAIEHAKREYPNESCGMIIDSMYIPCENVYEDKEKGFKIDKYTVLNAYQTNKLEAIVHSHCNTERPWATGMDIVRQERSGVPWGIVDLVNKSVRQVFFWGDQLPIQDLLERPFIHGVYDCFGLVRDYFRSKGYNIPNYPRDWGWWEEGKSVILDGISSSGFQLIPPEEIKAGDAMIGKIKFQYPNHCGVLLENGLILHHWAGENSLSCTIPYNVLSKYIIHGARYVNK